MTYRKRQVLLAEAIRGLGEHYGFTPREIGEMTPWQVVILCSKDPEEAGNKVAGKQKISYHELRRLANGR